VAEGDVDLLLDPLPPLVKYRHTPSLLRVAAERQTAFPSQYPRQKVYARILSHIAAARSEAVNLTRLGRGVLLG
jgi:hypothetical protein